MAVPTPITKRVDSVTVNLIVTDDTMPAGAPPLFQVTVPATSVEGMVAAMQTVMQKLRQQFQGT